MTSECKIVVIAPFHAAHYDRTAAPCFPLRPPLRGVLPPTDAFFRRRDPSARPPAPASPPLAPAGRPFPARCWLAPDNRSFDARRPAVGNPFHNLLFLARRHTLQSTGQEESTLAYSLGTPPSFPAY